MVRRFCLQRSTVHGFSITSYFSGHRTTPEFSGFLLFAQKVSYGLRVVCSAVIEPFADLRSLNFIDFPNSFWEFVSGVLFK